MIESLLCGTIACVVCCRATLTRAAPFPSIMVPHFLDQREFSHKAIAALPPATATVLTCPLFKVMQGLVVVPWVSHHTGGLKNSVLGYRCMGRDCPNGKPEAGLNTPIPKTRQGTFLGHQVAQIDCPCSIAFGTGSPLGPMWWPSNTSIFYLFFQLKLSAVELGSCCHQSEWLKWRLCVACPGKKLWEDGSIWGRASCCKDTGWQE